jgi:hypothetical protein
MLHHHDLVGVLEGGQPVGDRQHRAFLELVGDHLLDKGIVPDVDVGRGLVDEHHLAVLKEGAADAQQLLLASGQTGVRNSPLKPSLFLDDLPKVAVL